MQLILWLLAIQGVMGAFDLVYHHEMTEKLTWNPKAAAEMWLHGVRNGLYAVVFFSLGFLEWHGLYAYAFAAILVLEVTITLCDFVIEDRTRKLPATERVTHTLLALNYGAVLGLFMLQFPSWAAAPSGFAPVYYGFLSWVMGLYAVGVFIWFFRDYLRSYRLKKMAAAQKDIPADAGLGGLRVLVTGGSGFIGRALCRSLIASGCRIAVLTRDSAKAAAQIGGRVEFIPALEDLRDDDAFDIIINLAGEPIAQRWTRKAMQRMRDSRLDTTKQLVEFFARARTKPQLFISGSAIGWYGTHEGMEFEESSPPSAAGGVFARELCRDWEQEAAAAETFGIRTVLLRTGVVLEKDGGTLSELLFPFDFLIGGRLGHGRQWFSWIHRDDLVRLVLHIMKDNSIRGPVNATAPAPVRNAEFAAALGRAMKRPALLPLPAFVLRAVFAGMAEEVMLDGQKVLPQKALDAGFRFNHPTLASALGDIFAV